ncbi:MAG TPA: alpha/beta hydrolase [Thermoleophilaceae bacterium]|jgi:3-oxoadipate enol-lactonase
MADGEAREIGIASPAGVRLAVCQTGPPRGAAVVLLHGLTMTREYVLMGSDELERNGFRVIAYDARAHGRSTAPSDPEDYGYDSLGADLLAVLDALDVGRAVLVGGSMGCHTALRVALDHPERVSGIVAITPAFDPDRHPNEDDLRVADHLAAAIRSGGAEGYVAALQDIGDPAMSMSLPALTLRRLAQHRDLCAVADATQANLRRAPFDSFGDLAPIQTPTLVVGSRDKLDPRHPHDLARAYADAIPGAAFEIEPEGRAPIAWNGRKLARLVLRLALTTNDRSTKLPVQGS